MKMFSKKDDHLNLALKFHGRQLTSDFDNVQFVHQVFSNVKIDDVDISTSFAGFDFEQPFYINGMTGGTNLTKEYNEKLTILARETGIFMASGSMSVGLKDPNTLDSFKVIRKLNPNGVVFANLGAEKSLEDAKRACDILDANGLQIHVNIAQEVVMPEGDRDFSAWLDNIENIVANLGLPVVVKEVGFGMSRKAIKSLLDRGVKTVDISGKGGTNFARIENFRRNLDNKYDFLENYGNSTIVSLLEAQEFTDNNEILASGGVRNSLDIVKALAMGATAVGMAARYLNLVDTKSLDKAIEEVNNWKHHIKSLMSLLDAKNIKDLKNTDIILEDDVRAWADARNIDWRKFANRSK